MGVTGHAMMTSNKLLTMKVHSRRVVSLVANALESIPDSACGVGVSTRFQPEGHWLVPEVADQGVGIAPEHLAHLCDPFFTTKAAQGWHWLGSGHYGDPGARTWRTVDLSV